MMRLFDFNRPSGRFFCLLFAILIAVTIAHATGPGLTTVSDVVYRANGQTASGTVIVSWRSFTTRDGKAVGAGELSILLAADGSLSAALAPNEGASPSGVYYKVVYKLADGTTSTEYWVVPAASPTTIAAIRAQVVPSQVAAQLVSRQTLDSALAVKLDDSLAVHRAGDESIAGLKTFAASPALPEPTAATSATTKNYVDTAAATLVRKGGDSMTGQLDLALTPSAPTNAANKAYVDGQISNFSGNINSRLSRLNDTPVVLAGARYATLFGSIQAAVTDAGTAGSLVIPSDYPGADTYTNPNGIAVADMRNGGSYQINTVIAKQDNSILNASQFTGASPEEKIYNACASLNGAKGTVRVSSDMGGSYWTSPPLPENCTLMDHRGVTGPNEWGQEGQSFTHSIMFRGKSISTLNVSESQQALQVHFDSASGGLNQGGGPKTNYSAIMATHHSSTQGQSQGVEAHVAKTGNGDSVGLSGFNTYYGRPNAGGDEGAQALRGYVKQGTDIFTGSVASVSSTAITFTDATALNTQTLGEGRPVINTNRGVYSTGSISNIAGIPPTVSGSGTAWVTRFGAGAKTNLFFSPDWETRSGTKLVVPVRSISAEGQLTLDYQVAGADGTWGPNITSGTYKIFYGQNVNSFGTDVLNVAATSDFQAGDAIEQPVGYAGVVTGARVVIDQQLPVPSGAGSAALLLANVGPSAPDYGMYMTSSSSFRRLLNFASPASEYGINFFAPVGPSGLGPVLRYDDLTSPTGQVQLFSINDGAGNYRYFGFDRFAGNQQWTFDGNFGIRPSGQFGSGGSPQDNIQAWVFANSATQNLIVAANNDPAPTAALIAAQVQGVNRFWVGNSLSYFNSGTQLKFYSDNATTLKATIDGGTGAATFTGGITNNASANGGTLLTLKRFTDSTPTGNFLTFSNAANTALWNIDITGSLTAGSIPVARVSGLAPSATSDTTNAANITSGTLAAARLPGSIALSGNMDVAGGAGLEYTCSGNSVGCNLWATGTSSSLDLGTSNASRLTINAAGNVFVNTPGTTLSLAGATSGSTALKAPAAASGTLTLPATTDTLVGLATTDTLTNKTLTSPVMTGPTLGVPANVNGEFTAGIGVGYIRGSASVATQAASIVVTNLVAAAAAGIYEVCYDVQVTRAASTSSSIQVTIGWNNGAAQSKASTALTSNILNSEDGNCYLVSPAAVQNITYSTTYASAGGTTMQYSLRVAAERRQ